MAPVVNGRTDTTHGAPTSARRHWRWVGASAVGEAIGLVAANAVNVLVVPSFGVPEGRERLAVSALMIVAGALEGACLGAMQHVVLRRVLPGIRAVDWIAATSVGFAAGWLVGALASFLEPSAEPGPVVVVGLALLTGLMLGAAVGLAQAVVLWRHGVAVGRWLALTAGAWSIALVASYVGMSMLPVDWGWVSLLVGLVTGAVVGAIVGAITGLGLPRPRKP